MISYAMWLAIHIALGTLGMLLGVVALGVKKRRGVHTLVGEVYHWVMLLVCLTAGILSVLEWERIWWFLPIAAGSYAFALVGYVAAKRRWRGWIAVHIGGQGGSYIAMTTAVLINNWVFLTGSSGLTSPLAWALPTLLGTPLILWTTRRWTGNRRRPGAAASG